MKQLSATLVSLQLELFLQIDWSSQPEMKINNNHTFVFKILAVITLTLFLQIYHQNLTQNVKHNGYKIYFSLTIKTSFLKPHKSSCFLVCHILLP